MLQKCIEINSNLHSVVVVKSPSSIGDVNFGHQSRKAIPDFSVFDITSGVLDIVDVFIVFTFNFVDIGVFVWIAHRTRVAVRIVHFYNLRFLGLYGFGFVCIVSFPLGFEDFQHFFGVLDNIVVRGWQIEPLGSLRWNVRNLKKENYENFWFKLTCNWNDFFFLKRLLILNYN